MNNENEESDNERMNEIALFSIPGMDPHDSAMNHGSSSVSQDRQRYFANLVKRFFYQLTVGCSNPSCNNEYCASNQASGPINQREAAELSLALAKSGTLHLCMDSDFENAIDPSAIQEISGQPDRNAPKINLATIQSLYEKCKESDDYEKLADTIYNMFSKADSLCQSFTKAEIIPGECPTDLNQVRQAYKIIMEGPEVVSRAVIYGMEKVVSKFKTFGESIGFIDSNYLACILIILENPLMIEIATHATILPKLCEIFVNLQIGSANTKNPLLGSINENRGFLTLTRWIAAEYESHTFQRLLAIFQQFITMRLLTSYPINPNKDDLIIKATKAIGLLNYVNDIKDFVLYSEFYNDAINEQMEIKEDFPHWKAKEGFSFCNYAYVLTASTKTDILKVESMVQMRHELQDAFFRAIFAGVQSPYLVLEIRRDNIVRDALYQLDSKTEVDLKKQLRIQFVGEEGVDEGGVQKEFFQLVIREMFDTKYAMFQVNEESNLCWFTNHPFDDDLALEEYRLVGRLLGLAIYNSVILDVHFPTALYKKLNGKPVSLNDLKQFDPIMGNGLAKLLEFDGDVSSSYERTFQIEYDVFGAIYTHNLKPDGSSIPLTNDNRQEFVDLYVDFIFNKSVFRQFGAFKEGFDSVCAGSCIQLFRPEELELLVCGSPNLDFEALEKAVTYDNGYTADSQIIKWFWEIVHSFTEEEKRRLLFFTTGTDRVPIDGLSKLNFVIAKNGPDSDRLPTSHTCFNVLLLSEYGSKEKLKERLTTAIQNAEGFGLI